MMKKICILVPLLLLLPPVCGQVSGLRTQTFKHYNHLKSWYNARAHCRNAHTDLVTISDEKENQDFVSGRGWIGLYRDSTSKWKWSRRDEIANFTSWSSTEPGVGENCAFKYRGIDKWDADPCYLRHSYMCYDETLVLVKENKTWEEALKHCRALEAVDPSKPATTFQNHRYDLATLFTEDDQLFARKKAQGATTYGVWMGLRYLADQWVWVGGERVQNQDIKSCPTLRSCGVLEKNGTELFKTKNCEQKRNFLCYKKPETHLSQ